MFPLIRAGLAVPLATALLAVTPACSLFGLDGDGGGGDGIGDGGTGDGDGDGDGGDGDLTKVEDDLLALINEERTEAGLPALVRDPGMDRIMLFHASWMRDEQVLTHIDAEGRDAEQRARYYSTSDSARCLEIIQWWGGTPSGAVHYDGYYNSPEHHAAYMEEGVYNLGPTMHAGVGGVVGHGPAGSQFEDKSGSYTGVMLCDQPLELAIDPFEE